jgi:hypothetical protein
MKKIGIKYNKIGEESIVVTFKTSKTTHLKLVSKQDQYKVSQSRIVNDIVKKGIDNYIPKEYASKVKKGL